MEASQFNARTSPVLYTTSDTSKIQLLKLCSHSEVPLYIFESVPKRAAASSRTGVDFISCCQTQDKYLTELSFKYKIEHLQLIQKSILLSLMGLLSCQSPVSASLTKSEAFWMTNGS
jgi:hypothetical protein